MWSLQWPGRSEERLPIAARPWGEDLHALRATVLLDGSMDINALLTLDQVASAPASCELNLFTLA